MKKILDYSGVYKAKKGEQVVKATIRFFREDDLRGFDSVVALDKDKSLLDGLDIEVKTIKVAKK